MRSSPSSSKVVGSRSNQAARTMNERPEASDGIPRVVISLPCPACPDAAEPDPACPECDGAGIVLRRVEPEEAARSRTRAKPPRPDIGPGGPR